MRELKCTKNVKVKNSEECASCFSASRSLPTRALCVAGNAKYLDVVEVPVVAIVEEEPPKKRKKKK